MASEVDIPGEYEGWIVESSQWGSDDLDICGTAGGDQSTFIAERAAEPEAPIASPSSYRDKWKRR